MVLLANLVPVARTVGANKIVPTVSIPYPLGDPSQPEDFQWKQRVHRVQVALNALATEVEEQTVFDVEF